MSITSDEQCLIDGDVEVKVRQRSNSRVGGQATMSYDDELSSEGTKRLYDDFETIDWLRDLSKDRERHLRLERECKGIRGRIVYGVDAISGWVLVFLVGITAGLVASFVDVGTTWITDLRHGVCLKAFWLNREHCCWTSPNATYDRVRTVNCPEWYRWPRLFGIDSADTNTTGEFQNSQDFVIGFVMYIFLSLVYAFIAVMLVKVFAPYACGSGIPEIKTILSGFIMRGYLGRWTLLVKSIGMMLATSTSLVIGKEGPFVHIGCCCGNILSYLFKKYGANEAKKREILSAGAAAGVAVAFGAPLGGILFSLEEVSYYFPFKTLWRSFFCAMIGALVVRYVSPTARDIQFAIDYAVPWYYFELIAFAALGAMGGLWGAMYIKVNSLWCNYRRNSKLQGCAVSEVMTLAFLTSFLFYPNPYTRMTMSKLIQLMVGKCSLADQIDLCDYTWKYPAESSTVKLIPVELGQGVYSALWQLSLAALLIMVFMVFSIGSKIPSGLMIPSLCIGAVFGRIFGVLIEYVVIHYPHFFLFKYECGSLDQSCVTPGLYGLIGACAFLAGVTRMTVSLVVIMFEISGGLRYIVPLMIATMTAKWTADAFGKGGIYDSDIERQGYPFLDNKEEVRVQSVAGDLLASKPAGVANLVYLPKSGLTTRQLVDIVESSEHAVLPIVTSERTRYLYGQVIRKDLKEVIKRFDMEPPRLESDSRRIHFGAYDETLHTDDEIGTHDVINLHKIVDTAPMTVSHQEPTEILIDLFRKMGLRHAYVLHEGCLMGIITKKDIIRHIHEQLKNK